MINSRQLDWLIAPGDLVDGTTEIVPKRGDRLSGPTATNAE